MAVVIETLMAVRIAGDRTRALSASGRSHDEFEAELEKLAASGFVTGGPGSKLAVSPSGVAYLRRLLASEREALGGDDLPGLYQEFVSLDGQVKRVISQWQLTTQPSSGLVDASGGGSPNPLLVRLEQVHDEALRVLEAVARQRPRFGHYGNRLNRALSAIRQGKMEFVAGIRVDSYHLIWFELHENLLQTMGRKRSP